MRNWGPRKRRQGLREGHGDQGTREGGDQGLTERTKKEETRPERRETGDSKRGA